MNFSLASNIDFFKLYSFKKNIIYDSNIYESISSDEQQSENGRSIQKDSPHTLAGVLPATNCGSFDFKQETIDSTSFGVTNDGKAHRAGIKRPKIVHSIVDGSLGNFNDIMIARSFEGFEATGSDGTMQVVSKSVIKSDENTMFCDFIANELQNLKTDQFRRKLKLMFHKCVVEVTEEEEALLAKRDV